MHPYRTETPTMPQEVQLVAPIVSRESRRVNTPDFEKMMAHLASSVSIVHAGGRGDTSGPRPTYHPAAASSPYMYLAWAAGDKLSFLREDIGDWDAVVVSLIITILSNSPRQLVNLVGDGSGLSAEIPWSLRVRAESLCWDVFSDASREAACW